MEINASRRRAVNGQQWRDLPLFSESTPEAFAGIGSPMGDGWALQPRTVARLPQKVAGSTQWQRQASTASKSKQKQAMGFAPFAYHVDLLLGGQRAFCTHVRTKYGGIDE
jgi:hypothetical protein